MLTHIEGVKVVMVQTRGGHALEHAAEEAQALSDALDCDVTLIHNGTHVDVSPGIPWEGVVEDWWALREAGQ